MYYVEKIKKHKIIGSITESEEMAKLMNLKTKVEEIEQGYDGWYEKGYAPEKPEETLQEKLNRLEKEYQMNRWQREAILAKNSSYSEFTKARAKELEDIAEQIRKG